MTLKVASSQDDLEGISSLVAKEEKKTNSNFTEAVIKCHKIFLKNSHEFQRKNF